MHRMFSIHELVQRVALYLDRINALLLPKPADAQATHA